LLFVKIITNDKYYKYVRRQGWVGIITSVLYLILTHYKGLLSLLGKYIQFNISETS